MKRFAKLLTIAVAAIQLCLLSSCDFFSGSEEQDIQYIPFQSEKDGDWGLISPSGKVLFDGEFKNAPTIATCNRFWAQNNQGYYELYTAEAIPKQVNDKEYRYITPFYKNRAIVAERDKPISIIDRDGNTVKMLEKIDGVSPDYIYGLSEGTAIFTSDTVQGMINLDGEVLIPAKYFNVQSMYDGKAIAYTAPDLLSDYYLEEAEEEAAALNDDETAMAASRERAESFAKVFNKNGEVILTLSSKKYSMIGTRFYGDYLPVSKKTDGEYSWGLIDVEGNEVVKLNPKIKGISDMKGDNFIYYNDENHFGVMNIKGETIVRPEYDVINFLDKNTVVTTTFNEDRDGEIETKMINMKGETLNKGEYQYISQFIPQSKFYFLTEYKYAVAEIRDNHYTLIDTKGNRLQNLPKISYLYPYFDTTIASYSVSSDYIDIQAMLKEINFSATTLDGLNINTATPQMALERQARYYSYNNKPAAENYSYASSVTIYRSVCGEYITEDINYPGRLSEQDYYTKKVIDYVGYYYTWYHNEYIPTGYRFNTFTPSSFEIKFSNYGKLRGKLKSLYSALAEKVKGWGSVIASNKNAILVNMSDGNQATVYLEEHGVVIKWGRLDMSSSSIDKYEYVRESLSDA